jgi:hypothetical protein
MSDIADSLTEDNETRLETEAAAAAERIKGGQHWTDWITIGEGLAVGRQKAMRRSGTNQPIGAIYNRAFGEWLDAHKWARDLDKATRNHAIWCADNRPAVEAWRATLAENQRSMINHPSVTKRRYEATTKDKADTPGAAKETKAQQVERELEAMAVERDKWKRAAEKDGSLFDLKNDPAAIIAQIIGAHCTPYKLGEILKALAAERDRQKAVKKQAG